MWALISSLIEDLTVCYRRQLLRFHNNMELGIALMKNIICLKNTEKCQILKNFDKFSMFLCWICFLTKVVSTHCITVPFLKSPINFEGGPRAWLPQCQYSRPDCDCSSGTRGSSVPLHAGVWLGSSAPQNAPLHLGIHTRSKIR